MGLGHRPLFLLWTLVDKTLVARIVVWLMPTKAIKLKSLKEGNFWSPAALIQVGPSTPPHLSPHFNSLAWFSDVTEVQHNQPAVRQKVMVKIEILAIWPSYKYLLDNFQSLEHWNFRIWTLLDSFHWDRVHHGREMNKSEQVQLPFSWARLESLINLTHRPVCSGGEPNDGAQREHLLQTPRGWTHLLDSKMYWF